jgi:hypothetical protein
MIYPSHPLPAVPLPSGLVAPTHGGGIATGAVHRPQEAHYDPAGKLIAFTSTSVCDQQVGGDLSGREPDVRDGNFIDESAEVGRKCQLERDMGTGVDDFHQSKAPKPSR